MRYQDEKFDHFQNVAVHFGTEEKKRVLRQKSTEQIAKLRGVVKVRPESKTLNSLTSLCDPSFTLVSIV